MVGRLNRSESRARTRSALVRAAVHLFARDGVAATSIEAVCEEAGYSRGAFHGNFTSRDELVDAVVSVAVDGLAPELESLLRTDEPAPVRLGRYIDRFLAFCEEQPDETKALVAVVRHRAVNAPGSYDTAVRGSLSDLEGLFEEGQVAGSMRDFDRTMMADLVRRSLDAQAARIAGRAVRARDVSSELVEIFQRATRADA